MNDNDKKRKQKLIIMITLSLVGCVLFVIIVAFGCALCDNLIDYLYDRIHAKQQITQSNNKNSEQYSQAPQQNLQSAPEINNSGSPQAQTLYAATPVTDFAYDFNEDYKSLKITRYKGEATTIVIPESIEGFPVTCISEGWFQPEEDTLYNIIVPKSIKEIEYKAFYSIKGTINIDISNLTYIGAFAFCESDLWGTIIFSNATKYVTGCFASTKITTVVVQEGVTCIENAMFAGCANLKSVTLPSSIKEIGFGAFGVCKSLTEVIIPEGVKIRYLNDEGAELDAFMGCTALPPLNRLKIIESGYKGIFNIP